MNRLMIKEYLLGDSNKNKIDAMCKAKGFRSLKNFLAILAGFNKAEKGKPPSAE
tara:strand:+ start:160 stop:321 length:162 start_codon:yes stop_codon:yes gene_type:complete